MHIALSPQLKLTTSRFTEMLKMSIHDHDPGLDLVTYNEDRAVGCIHYRLERSGLRRQWKIVVCADGSAMTSHPSFGLRRHPDVTRLERYIHAIIEQGHD